MDIVLVTIASIATIVGVVIGIIQLVVKPFNKRKEIRKQKEIALQEANHILQQVSAENEYNLRNLEEFWRQAANTIDDQDSIEMYHRLAYTSLHEWKHMMWDKHATSSVLTKEVMEGMYKLKERHDAFLRLREEMRNAFESTESKKLWDDFTAWKSDLRSDNLDKRIKANEEWGAITMRTNKFFQSHLSTRQAFATLYNTIVASGNPIKR